MFAKSLKIAVITALATTLLFSAVIPVVFASAVNFAITDITASCNGTGQVTYTGTIPQGGFTLELMDKAPDNSGPFISTVPATIITITTGGSPVSYTLPLTNWNPPHLRIDSNYNTKSPSLNCEGDPNPTPTPTITVTATPTPTITPTPTPDDPGDQVTPTPTSIVTPTPTVTETVTPNPTPTPTTGSSDNNSSNNDSGSNNQSQGQVLGAATEFTGTGVAEDVLASVAGLSGVLLMGTGICVKFSAKS